MKEKGIIRKKMWAIFSPEGHIQFRSISDSKELTESLIGKNTTTAWCRYKKAGFTIKKIILDIKVY